MIKNKFLLAFIILTSNSVFLESSNLVIKNAEIYDGIENNSYQGHILISEGVISKISKTSIPYAEKIYDAQGKIVTPGFIAPDTQIGIIEIGALSVTRDDEASIYNIGFSIHDAFNPNSVLIPWNRANGITSAITLPRNTSSPIGGLGSFFLLDSNLDISSEADIVMIGRFGGSGSSSRAETLALIDDMLSFVSSLDKKDMSSDASIDEVIDDSSLWDGRTVGPSDRRTVGPSDSRMVGRSNGRMAGRSDSRAVGWSVHNFSNSFHAIAFPYIVFPHTEFSTKSFLFSI